MHLKHSLEIIKVTKVRDRRDVGVHYIQMTPTVISRMIRHIEDCVGTKSAIRGWEKIVWDNYKEKGALLDFLPCHHCRKPIPEFTICISKRKGGPMRGYYHPDCARKIHIINS